MTKFSNYTKEDYKNAGVISLEPMSAKEPLNEEQLEEMLTSKEYIAEEKLDGTRATMHLREEGNRLFSRRISKKTNWYAENSDNLPHLRDLEIPQQLLGTIIDGELIIEGKGFKEISSVMNCLPQEAIKRQEELGKVTFHAFDIIYYKGVYIAKMPLWRRKQYLKKVIDQINDPYLVEEYFIDELVHRPFTSTLRDSLLADRDTVKNKYPNLYPHIQGQDNVEVLHLNKKAWYEYILIHDGEGLMLKNKESKYRHARGREYTKLKKFETWDCIVFGYTEPTTYYSGKETKKSDGVWCYWCDVEDEHMLVEKEMTMIEGEEYGLFPVTKHYIKDWIGTLQLGVIMTKEDLAKWSKNNRKEARYKEVDADKFLVYIGECSGFDEETRDFITKHKEELLNTVVEIKGQEVLKKTGAIRHPRYIRQRLDKDMLQCTWKEHIRE